MSAKAILLSAVGVAAGGAAEEIVLQIPRGYEETLWHRVVARNGTTDMTIIEIWLRVHAWEYCLVGGAPGAIARTVHVNTSLIAPDDAQFVAKFTTAVAGDVLGLWAFGKPLPEGSP